MTKYYSNNLVKLILIHGVAADTLVLICGRTQFFLGTTALDKEVDIFSIFGSDGHVSKIWVPHNNVLPLSTFYLK